jgi:hypothetical protein
MQPVRHGFILTAPGSIEEGLTLQIERRPADEMSVRTAVGDGNGESVG